MESPDTDAVAPRWDGARERRAFLVAGLITAIVVTDGIPGSPVALGFMGASWMGSLLLFRYAWVDRGAGPGPATARNLVVLGSGALLCLIPSGAQASMMMGARGGFTVALPCVLVSMAAAIVLVRGLVGRDPPAGVGIEGSWRFRAGCAAMGTLAVFFLGPGFARPEASLWFALAPWAGIPLLVWSAGSIPDGLHTLAHVRVVVVAAGAAGTYGISQAGLLYLSGRASMQRLPLATVVAALVAVLGLMVLGAAAVKAARLLSVESE